MRLLRPCIISLAAALTLPAAFTVLAPSASASPATGGSIAALATANVGKKACSTNSLGGKAFYSSCTGDGGQPEYWCADFARWVWANSGVQDTNWVNAAAGSFYVYGLEFGTLSATPAVGDAVVFDYHGGGAADHVAVVTQANANGTIETMSGDWNGESGSEAHFSSTALVVANTPAYLGQVGSTSGETGMTISGFVAPVGADVVPVIGGTSLFNGQTMTAGERITSPNGQYSLNMQSDGNLVEYVAGRALWATGTEGNVGDHVAMQTDGNLVVYSLKNTALWSSGTGGHSGAFDLTLLDTAGLVINGRGGPLWSRQPQTGVLLMGQTLLPGERLVSPNGLYSLQMQAGGSLAEYTAGRGLWASGTEGLGDRVVMQADGNLVIYSPTNQAVWSSRTGGRSGEFSLTLDDYGDVILNGPSGPLWSNRV
jgi:surface antigen